MKSQRREARELAMKILYQVEVGHRPLEEVMETTTEAVRIPEEEREYVEDVVRGVLDHRDELDQVIGDLATGWKLERIAQVDRNILRVALYEIQRRSDIPESVSVNEAVEMAKKYSTSASGRFVNGILGSYLRTPASSRPPPEPAPPDAVEEDTMAPTSSAPQLDANP
jgi:transcription antitermination protein NusB